MEPEKEKHKEIYNIISFLIYATLLFFVIVGVFTSIKWLVVEPPITPHVSDGTANITFTKPKGIEQAEQDCTRRAKKQFKSDVFSAYASSTNTIDDYSTYDCYGIEYTLLKI